MTATITETGTTLNSQALGGFQTARPTRGEKGSLTTGTPLVFASAAWRWQDCELGPAEVSTMLTDRFEEMFFVKYF